MSKHHQNHKHASRVTRTVVRAVLATALHRTSVSAFGGGWAGPGIGRGFGGRRFARGHLKYAILDLLQDGPRHGYDIIRAIEERSHGFYSPSPGSIYPTLQLLEDQGHLVSSEQDGKRVYTITEEGRSFLKERSETVDDVRARAKAFGEKVGPEMRDLASELRDIAQAVFRDGGRNTFHDAEKLRRIRDVVARARVEIESIVRSEPPANGGEPADANRPGTDV